MWFFHSNRYGWYWLKWNSYLENQICFCYNNHFEVVTDCQWSGWGSWTSCTEHTTGDGFCHRHRERPVLLPPTNGGRGCDPLDCCQQEACNPLACSHTHGWHHHYSGNPVKNNLFLLEETRPSKIKKGTPDWVSVIVLAPLIFIRIMILNCAFKFVWVCQMKINEELSLSLHAWF